MLYNYKQYRVMMSIFPKIMQLAMKRISITKMLMPTVDLSCYSTNKLSYNNYQGCSYHNEAEEEIASLLFAGCSNFLQYQLEFGYENY